jgi:hypothetical protein
VAQEGERWEERKCIWYQGWEGCECVFEDHGTNLECSGVSWGK